MSNLPGGFTPFVATKAEKPKALSLSFYKLGSKNASAYLSAGAIDALQRPTHIELGFDAELGRVAVVAAKESQAGAIRVAKHGTGAKFTAGDFPRLAFPDAVGTLAITLTEEKLGLLIGTIEGSNGEA